MKATVIQYMRPNGRPRRGATELPDECQPYYDSMRDAGCRLEGEILSTGECSMTVTNDEEDIDISVTKNGPEVLTGIEEMLKRQLWLREEARS